VTVIDETTQAAPPGPVGPDLGPASKRVLLIWDAPNLDMGLGSILGGRPTAAHRPRFDALGRWLLHRTAELSAEHPGTVLEPEATVFTNIAAGRNHKRCTMYDRTSATSRPRTNRPGTACRTANAYGATNHVHGFHFPVPNACLNRPPSVA
jgi:hypothetical protein